MVLPLPAATTATVLMKRIEERNQDANNTTMPYLALFYWHNIFSLQNWCNHIWHGSQSSMAMAKKVSMVMVAFGIGGSGVGRKSRGR